jgi:hypothetical protein
MRSTFNARRPRCTTSSGCFRASAQASALRSLSKTLPIIFLTARDSDIDSVHGLRLGADDYVTKDMSMDHLLARVTALLRRADAWAEALKQPDEVVHRGLWPEQGKAEGLPQFIIFSSPDRQIVAPDRRFHGLK